MSIDLSTSDSIWIGYLLFVKIVQFFMDNFFLKPLLYKMTYLKLHFLVWYIDLRE
jgi:hypothetical protein